jgi:hypothetical protein
MLREVSSRLKRCDCVQGRSVRHGLTTQLERTEQSWSVLQQKLLAAAQLER